VTRVPPFDRPANYDDLLQQPDDLVAEILDGELHVTPRPTALAAGSAFTLGGMLRRASSAGDPDGWQILNEPELRLGADVLVPALAGWRVSRLPQLPLTPYFTVAPDWVCEIPAPYPASLRSRRMAIYAGEGVTHAWLLDPVAQALEVRRLEAGRWSVVATHVGGQLVRAAPFEAVELQLSVLWPREPGKTRRGR
jgi:Uma2 family endonuclease